MTKTDFLKEHGAEWRKFARKPAFDALLTMIDDEGPARKLTGLTETDKLNGSPVFLNDICGWEKLRKLLNGLAAETDATPEAEDKYEKPEV